MKRCGWCKRPLRWWQREFCRICARSLDTRDVGMPYRSGSRRNAKPDGLIRSGDHR